ncbi:hypothetical protein [Bacillus atrophaeus]|uniref:hypothetical protein n=1 Tax=Bacillus atrophaeus TaxID=1452 RepID=UPI002DB70FEB|nr:hypothetical protein [Bacillus atrophaeus]MEC2309038.1 hypothetical protein [Bacillus atrophaeus]
MNILNVFRNYIEEYHSDLAFVRTISVQEISNEEVKELPEEYKLKLKCWVFFYYGGQLVKPISFKRG